MGSVVGAVSTLASVVGAVLGIKQIVDPDKPKAPEPLTEVLNYKQGVYTPATTQDVNLGYKNYLNSLLKISPRYVSRYKPERLRDRYTSTVTTQEEQLARDQPKIHTKRRAFLAQQQRRKAYARTQDEQKQKQIE
jgi:hypothetical protein